MFNSSTPDQDSARRGAPARGRAWMWLRNILFGISALLLSIIVAAGLFLRGSLARLDGTVHVPGLHASVEVARDTLGVPMISGSDRLDVAYATGFVHGQERFFQMDLLRRSAAGELAELFGARALPVDQSHRLHRFRARADAALLALAPDERRLLDRYVAGVNEGLADLAARPFEYALTGTRPRTWSAADSLLVIWAMYFDLQGNQAARELARGWIARHSNVEQREFLLPESTQWDAPLDAPDMTAPPAAIPLVAPDWWGQPKRADAQDARAEIEWFDAVGSNNWALAGSRTGDGAAIVANDMHLGLRLPNIWYRAALRFPDPGGVMRRIVGVTLPGAPPFVVAGSNGRVAWGYTNSYGDYLDLVELGYDAGKPGQVRTPSGWERLTVYQESILVKGAPPQPLLVRECSLGPLREVAGRSYAVHWVAHAAAAVNLKAGGLERAATLDDALVVAAGMGIPAQNFIAGDERGNIGWTIAGALPRRARPGLASTFPLAAGAAGLTWQGLLDPERYPRVHNPASGQLSSANSRQLMGAGSELLGDGGFDLGARARQIRDDLTALGPKTDVAGAYSVALDDRALFMAGWRARALAVLDGAALDKQPQRAQFLAWLRSGWDGHASVDSVAYPLARGFMYALYDIMFEGANGELARLDEQASVAGATSRWPVLIGRLLDAQPAAWLPRGYANWREVQLAAIDRVIRNGSGAGRQRAGSPWGERNTAAIVHPLRAALPWLRPWLEAPPDRLPGDIHMPRVAGPAVGPSERLTVSPGREEQGWFNMPGGQSAHPWSPFFLAGHGDWVAARPAPLLPGPPRHVLKFVR